MQRHVASIWCDRVRVVCIARLGCLWVILRPGMCGCVLVGACLMARQVAANGCAAAVCKRSWRCLQQQTLHAGVALLAIWQAASCWRLCCCQQQHSLHGLGCKLTFQASA